MSNFERLNPQQLLSWRLQLSHDLGHLQREKATLETNSKDKHHAERYRVVHYALMTCCENIESVSRLLRERGISTAEIEKLMHPIPETERQVQPAASLPPIAELQVLPATEEPTPEPSPAAA